MITRGMVTLGPMCNNRKRWITMKVGGARIGVVTVGFQGDEHKFTWRELGFNQKPEGAKSPSEAVARLLLRMNGGHDG